MVDTVAVDLSVEIKVLNDYATEYRGSLPNSVEKNGDIRVGKGKVLSFNCIRPFALYIKGRKKPDVPSPSDDNELMYCGKWNQGQGHYETTPPVKLKSNLDAEDWYDYGVVVLNPNGTLQLHDPRILID